MSRILIYATIFMVTSAYYGHSSTQKNRLENSRVLAVVPLLKGTIDQDVYRQFDRLVPELKKVASDNIIKLECRYTGQSAREPDVLKAYRLALLVEKYLRERHKLNLDLWITISPGEKKTVTTPVLEIAIFGDDMKRLDSLPFHSKKTDQL